MPVEHGKDISIEYTLKLADGQIVDTNVGGEPLTYRHGARQIVPGLEKALEAMEVGEEKTVEVPPGEGYGEVQQEAFLRVDKGQIPPQALKVGAQLQGQTADGRVLASRVTEIQDDAVILDFNHPLAGKDLLFEIKILAIAEAPVQ